MTIFAVENFLIIPNLALPLMQGKLGSGLNRTNQQFLRGKFSNSLKKQHFKSESKKQNQGLIDQRAQTVEANEIEADGILKVYCFEMENIVKRILESYVFKWYETAF